MTAKPCRICSHKERRFIDALLAQGNIAPRSMTRRIGNTTRRSLTYHRSVCLQSANNEHGRNKP